MLNFHKSSGHIFDCTSAIGTRRYNSSNSPFTFLPTCQWSTRVTLKMEFINLWRSTHGACGACLRFNTESLSRCIRAGFTWSMLAHLACPLAYAWCGSYKNWFGAWAQVQLFITFYRIHNESFLFARWTKPRCCYFGLCRLVKLGVLWPASNPITPGEGSGQTPTRHYQSPFHGGCTNQFQTWYYFPTISLAKYFP